MPIPILFIGVAVATGAVGIGGGVKAGIDQNKAKHINANATEIVQYSAEMLEIEKNTVKDALVALGNEKLFILNNSINEFLETFQKIKNVAFFLSIGFSFFLFQFTAFTINIKTVLTIHFIPQVKHQLRESFP